MQKRVGIAILLTIAAWWPLTRAGLLVTRAAGPGNDDISPAARSWLNSLITSIAREQLPERFEDRKHWGMQAARFDGLKVSGKGLKLDVDRRKKLVNHGTWRQYSVEPVEPDKYLKVEVGDFQAAGPGKYSFDVVGTARLDVSGRISQWEYGVQLASLSAEAEATVRLRMRFELAVRTEEKGVLPDMIFEPRATSADLTLVHFRVRHISKLDGPLAREIGRGLEDVVERKLEEKRDKLVEKVNRQLAKHQNEFRFSPSGIAAEKWKNWTGWLHGS